MKVKFLKNYFLEILLFFIVTSVLTMILLSLFLYNTFEKSTATMVNNLNQEFLSETHRINQYLQKMIRISGMELFFEPTIQKIMYHGDISNFDVVMAIRRLDSIMSMGLHTHSIYVYNATKEYFYVTSNLDSNTVALFYDTDVLRFLEPKSDFKRLAPIPRFIATNSGPRPVYSFVFYENPLDGKPVQGALVFNITLDWLREVFRDDDQSQSTVIFVDRVGRIAYHSDQTNFLKDIHETPYFKRISQSAEPNGYFLHKGLDGNQLVFYSTSEDNELYLIRMYPYAALMGGIDAMRDNTGLLVLLFVMGAIIISFALSRRLYKPIHQLLRKVDPIRTDRQNQESDLGYLSSSIEHMMSRNELLEKTSVSYQLSLQKDILKEILQGRGSSNNNLVALFKEYGLPFSLDQPFRMVAVKGIEECNLDCLGLANCMTVPMKNKGYFVLFQNQTASDERRYLAALKLRGARMIVTSGRIDSPDELSHYAKEMEELLCFSFLYKEETLLSLKTFSRTEEPHTYPTNIEGTFIHFLGQGRSSEAISIYTEFFNAVCDGSFDHFKFSMKRLFISVQLTINELRSHGLFSEYRGMEVEDFDNILENLEDRDILDQLFMGFCHAFRDEINASRLKKAGKISDQVIEIVERDYANPNLSLNSIADSIGMSASYLAKIFKDSTSCSINDFLLNHRMEAAKRLLLSQSAPAREIASLVGIDNENYFYTVFKKKTGQTPNAFRKKGGDAF